MRTNLCQPTPWDPGKPVKNRLRLVGRNSCVTAHSAFRMCVNSSILLREYLHPRRRKPDFFSLRFKVTFKCCSHGSDTGRQTHSLDTYRPQNKQQILRHSQYLHTGPWTRLPRLFAGIAVDGPNKSNTDINSKSICLIKKSGKVKALDEELYSESTRVGFSPRSISQECKYTRGASYKASFHM